MNPQYDSITNYVDGMIAKVESHPDWMDVQGLSDDIATWLKDFKTVGYSTPRQVGGAFWLHHQFLNHPNSLLITLNESVKNGIRDNYTRNGEPAFTFLGKCDHPDSEIGITARQANRIFTHSQFAQFVKAAREIAEHDTENRTIAGIKPTRIYIDGSEKFFKHCRANKFYEYLANYVLRDGEGWIIKYA